MFSDGIFHLTNTVIVIFYWAVEYMISNILEDYINAKMINEYIDSNNPITKEHENKSIYMVNMEENALIFDFPDKF
jgi:hypothetical protein